MSGAIKTEQAILEKLRIESLNAMQEEAKKVISSGPETVLLSPTGTGKTLAFLLPIIAQLNTDLDEVQVLVLVPSRELAIQIEQVTREMGSGFKANAVYGGKQVSKDKMDLKHRPAVLIGTPGRVADHIRRGTFSTQCVETLVLDEFDKSLEVGFEEEMKEILQALPGLRKKVLTSATQGVEIPTFVGLKNPRYVDFLDTDKPRLEIRTIISPTKDKLETLFHTLCHLGNQPGIVFCNFKDSIKRVSDYLTERGVPHGCFYGGMEQQDRERALIKFRNGTHQLIIATDLAARGIDVPEIQFIVHYHLPLKAEEFTHRNGRTARMHNDGKAYVIQWTEEFLPEYIEAMGSASRQIEKLNEAPVPAPSPWKTLLVSGGRRDKISKGDLAGLFFKQGGLKKDELGLIELKQDCAFVAVKVSNHQKLMDTLNHSRVKTKRVKITLV